MPEWVKRAVFYRDRGRCVLCGKDLSGQLAISRIYTKCGKCTGKGVEKGNSSKCRNRTGIGRYVRKCLIYKENYTFGYKKLKVLFLYLFLG